MASNAVDINKYRLDARFQSGSVIHQKRETKGRRFREKWTNEKKLGEGGQGYVYLQREGISNKLRAVKKLHTEYFDSNGLDVKQELRNMARLRNVSCTTFLVRLK